MAKKLTMQIYPAPILHQRTEEISAEELSKPEFAQLLLDMEETIKQQDGIGLAAPQVGKSIRFTIVKTEDGILPLVNPKIVRRSIAKDVMEEGCLSVPGVYGDVKRSKTIKVVAQDMTGKKIKFSARGMFARVIQHEVEHLNGILFIDKAIKINEGKEILAQMEQESKRLRDNT